MIKLIKAKDKDLLLLMQEQSEAEMQDWGEQKSQIVDYEMSVCELYHAAKKQKSNCYLDCTRNPHREHNLWKGI